MSQIVAYLGIESLALTGPQQAAFLAALAAIGKQSDPQPFHVIHTRIRLDNAAMILCAEFNDAQLTVASIQQFLATTFGVNVNTITPSVSSATFDTIPSPVVTYTYAAVARIRFVAFGGLSSTWDQGAREVRGYLKANAAAWEPAAS